MNLTLRRQSVVRGLRRDGCMGAIGRPARSLATKCQTNLVFPAGSAGFASAACGAPRKPDRPRDYCPVLGDRRSLAPYCRVLPVRSIAGYCRSRPWRSLAASGVLPYRARTSCSDCLDCLRPSERRSVSQAWSRCCSGGMQGWSDWSGADAKLASQVRGGLPNSCAGETVPILAPNAFGEVSAR